MNIITNATKIDQLLVKLMQKYKNYYIATAWASLGSESSDLLLEKKEQINKMVVGTHFYQTHPDFILEFLDSRKVKFILKTSGVFHPKVYLFSNNKKDWECIIGSANFTKSALTINDEIVAHIKSSDSDSDNVYHETIKIIEKYWESAETINEFDYNNYLQIWKKNITKLNSLEKYGSSKNSKPLVKSKIFSLNWSEYYKRIQNDKFHSFLGRIELLKTANMYFSKSNAFCEMNKIQRRELAGIATENQSNTGINWKWFGSMVGAGKFQNRINENDEYISKALDTIPFQGEVYQSNYISFVDQFQKAFPGGGSGIAIASRLLTMKRPDYFVCLDKQNRPKLIKEFGISQSISFNQYWDEIIERILDSVWWLSERPTDKTEIQAWKGRSALLDVLFYSK